VPRGRTFRSKASRSASPLDHLIALKEAAGRPNDRLMATGYRVLSDVLRAPEDAHAER